MRNSTLKICAMLLAFCTSTIHLHAMDEWDGKTIAKGFYSGIGTKSDPYRIFTASQFLYFIQQIKDGNTFSNQYIDLCNDIAFSHEAVDGYGDFCGDFDGNDHKIQINTDGDESYYWNFCRLYGSIHDVQFVNACNIMSIYTGGILYNCRFEFNGYHGSYTVDLEGGTIANCVSNSAYFRNSYKYGGAYGFVNSGSSGYCSNCYFPITSISYGGSYASNYYGVTESCGEAAGNDWVQSHTERAYKSWPLTFNPTYPDYNVTMTFVDEYGFVSYDAKTYLANSTIGELPIPDVDHTFLGWKYNGTYVQSTDVITHDMVLYADWKHEIKVQPTIYEPSVLCNDKEHAKYQWYYQERMPIIFDDITNSTSTQTKYIEVSDDDVILSFDFEAHGYEYSGNYRDYEEEAWITVNGETIVYVYSEKEGSYSCQVSAGTHKISCRRSDITNIRISCPTDTLANETSSVLPKQTIMNRPGAYFCKVTYSNNGDELISDFVDYEKLTTIDNVTYVVNEDATATVLWVADKAVDITILETVYYDGVNYPVTSISSKAFVDCTSLASIKCKTRDGPALLGNTTFEGLKASNVTLYVLIGNESAYSKAEGWKEFGKIIGVETEVELVDGQTFTNNNNKVIDNITYTRTLPNLEWNSLFVPFEIPVSDLTDYYDVAYINDIHSYDWDFNGEIDQMEMEVIYIKEGTLHANHPYLIRAKYDGAKEMTIGVTDATLYSSAKADRTSITCSSAYTNFEVVGTYEKMTAEELNGCYAINTSGAWTQITNGGELNPFRLYMTITSRDGSPVKVSQSAQARINIRVQGEDTETDITDTENRKVKTENVDLTGRRVERIQNGIYIVNGKKVVSTQ